jgi:23S rRNA (cytosine1962-C5)-methyltransferase
MGGLIRLRRGRAKPVWAGHPRVMSGAVASVEGEPGSGEVVLVVDEAGRPIGRGLYCPDAPVRVWMLTRDPEARVDGALFARRVARALSLRERSGLPSEDTTAYRLLHGDGDRLPGVVADRYGDFAVLELTVPGMEDRRETIARQLLEVSGLRGVLARPAGDGLGEPVPAEVEVLENGIRYLVDPRGGQKTGHFADQRENRRLFARFVRGARVLDAFTGTGGFALAAAAAGAERILAVDSSAAALERAERNAERNGVGERVEFVRGDAFRVLRRLLREGERFDAACIDPPRMASRRRELRGALRGYKELNLRGLGLVEEGGLLATSSCTGLLSEEGFLRVLRDASLDAGRRLTVLFLRGQGPDHPWSPTAPESRYLKFLLGRVD